MIDFPAPEIIASNGIELEVFTAGAPGTPLLLCHGWPEHAFSWRHQLPALAAAGYHVIAPNQRGYGRSSRPEAVGAYDITHLAGDLLGLLDHFGYEDAVFVGHDWGAIVVWQLAQLHPGRVRGLANLSVPLLLRGPTDWVSFWESQFGGDFYIVHFNRQPGVADAVFDANTENFLRQLYVTRQWLEPAPPAEPGMALINAARRQAPPRGEPLMTDAELAVFVEAFEHSGFTGGINWYRNFSRNWSLLADVSERITVPALMIYGDYDIVPKFEALGDYVADLEVVSLPCGHWIQQEMPDASNQALLEWLGRRFPPA